MSVFVCVSLGVKLVPSVWSNAAKGTWTVAPGAAPAAPLNVLFFLETEGPKESFSWFR